MEYKLREWAIKKYGKERMEKVITDFINQAEERNVHTMKMQLTQNANLNRLEKLIRNNQNIEYMSSSASLIEHSMRRLIRENEFVINSSLMLGDFDTPLKLREKAIGENYNASGNLLNELERYYDKGSHPLLGRLSQYNKHRKTATHKLCDLAIDPEVVNQSLAEYVSTRPITQIMQDFAKEHKKLIDKMVEKVSEFGYITDRNAPDLKELERKAREIDKKQK